MGADQYPEHTNGAATCTARLVAGLARAGHTVLRIARHDIVHVRSHLGLGPSPLRGAKRSGIPVGVGSLRPSLEALTQALGFDTTVTLLGAVDDDELLVAYARADVFVMPGTAELQGIATLEAMATGLPVVAADAMALPHLVCDGVNGRLYAPGDVGRPADDLQLLLRDPPMLVAARVGAGLPGRDLAMAA